MKINTRPSDVQDGRSIRVEEMSGVSILTPSDLPGFDHRHCTRLIQIEWTPKWHLLLGRGAYYKALYGNGGRGRGRGGGGRSGFPGGPPNESNSFPEAAKRPRVDDASSTVLRSMLLERDNRCVVPPARVRPLLQKSI